jgi:hypothetical protein
MRNITDNDLTLLYYGEQDDPALAAQVAASPELSARFEALSKELEQLDALVPPPRGDDYGVELWQTISPRLADRNKKPQRRWLSILTDFRQTRFNLAGAAAVMLIAVLAFALGRQGSSVPESAPMDPAGLPALVQAEFDNGRLLNTTVADHLEQLNIVFTQFVNSSETPAGEAERATDMLVANRLYRQAAVTRGEHQLAAFLGELEPLLIEMAYEAYKSSPATRERMQEEMSGRLLFRVRVMNQQLKNSRIST